MSPSSPLSADDAARFGDLAGAEIVVPGSTSNLGPGFDALGLALGVSLRLRVTGVRDDGHGDVEWRFVGSTLEGENAIHRGYRAGLAAAAAAGAQAGLPSLTIDVTTDIPMKAGLGSSAAALVAGLRLAERLTGTQPMDTLLRLACGLEGHPDNTSASLLGGFVAACRLEDGRVVAHASPWPASWPLVVATPALALETKVARAALPASVSMADAVFNVQRVALLVHAARAADTELLRAALADRLHQPYRAPLVPGLAEALAWRADGLLGVFLSGAGPSIAAIVDASVPGAVDEVRAQFDALYRRLALPVAVRTLHAREPFGTHPSAG